MSRDGRKTGGGTRKGIPNKATADVRAAIALVLQTNADNFGRWLQGVAEGEKEFEPELDEDGEPILDEHGQPKGTWDWLRRPEPATALKLSMDMAEFHFPKLARTEFARPQDDKDIPILKIEFVK